MIQFQYIDGFCKYTENDESHESKYIQAINLKFPNFKEYEKSINAVCFQYCILFVRLGVFPCRYK